MTDIRDSMDDESRKLLPESSRSEDEQILWLAFGVIAILAFLMFGISQCGGTDGLVDNFTVGSSADADSSIDLLFDDDNQLSNSASFFGQSDYDSDLADADSGPFTVLAPSNDAWDSAAELAGQDDGAAFIDSLSDNDSNEGAGFHVIDGKYTLAQLQAAGTVATVGGYDLVFGDDDLINGVVSVDKANIEANNGLVHRIDGLFPAEAAVEPTAAPEPTAVAEPDPTPEPAPEPTAVPTAAPAPTAVPTAVPAPPAAFTIANLAGDTPDLSTLVGLAGTLGLDAALADPDAGPFTVFAPTNDAFDNSSELLGALSDGDVESTVQYHVVPGVIPASEVVPGARFETLNGQTLVISSDGSLPGGINVITPDLETDNGVVHVIDGVLVPAPITLSILTADLVGIQFDVSSANIRPESDAILVQAASVLNTLPEGTLVEIAGHTDSDGGAEGNQALSEARANSVLTRLVSEGVDAELLTAVGYGEEDLKVDPEVTDEDKQANRRIEFTSPRS